MTNQNSKRTKLKKNLWLSKGFTFIEIIVAILVMAVGIVGVYAIVPRIISLTAINTNRFIASQLAREGIEIVRNMRDTNWLKRVPWDEGLTNCSTGCEIDYDDASFTPWVEPGRYLRINSNGFYNYDPVSATNSETKFKRKITITKNGDILNVKVEVIWPGKGSPFEVEENLANWLIQ